MESAINDTNSEDIEANQPMAETNSCNGDKAINDGHNLAQSEQTDQTLHGPVTGKDNDVNSDTLAKLNISTPMELDKGFKDSTVSSKSNSTFESADIKDMDKMDESMKDTSTCITESCDSAVMVGIDEVIASLDDTKIKMLARVAVSEAHFKHQQRGEPDLTLPEKIEIAQSILESNSVSFLAKFANYLELEDLQYFEKSRTSYEVDFYCKQVERSKSRNFSENRVKNRRYQALKELISKNEYFSDDEMKFREPYLYHQMVGQHLTDDEIQASIDKSDLKFSSILVRHIDQLNENERFSRAKDKEEGQVEEEEESDEEEMEECEEKTTETDEVKEKISDDERQELRAEFLTIMQERFLQGEDKHFNYSEVDNNEDYDDLNVLSNDAEEKYFDDEDPESIHSDSNM